MSNSSNNKNMDQLMRDIPRNMRRTGMLLFRDAFIEAYHGEKLMCVVHAAHATEILLKARIAQEHPLLIFSELPTLPKNSKNNLTLIDLLERGRTLSYKDLPNYLWATTGIKIEPLDQYIEFGRIRNQIIHLSMPNTKKALDELTLLYSLDVLDPLVESFWGRSVFDFISNDPLCEMAHFLTSGLVEDRIKDIHHPIDERLRRLLGETSRENLEYLKIHSEIEIKICEIDEMECKESFHTMPGNDLKHEEENLQDINPSASQFEHLEHWETFLNSF